MAHTPPPRPTIDELGLPHWIDAGRGSQNGYGWSDFDFFCSIKVPDTVLGRIFNKSPRTVYMWKKKREEMQ